LISGSELSLNTAKPFQSAASQRIEARTALCQRHALPRAIEQAQADMGFEDSYLPAQRRLRHMSLVRGCAEGTRVRYRDEIVELTQRNRGAQGIHTEPA
jgi:hypothetical protein